MFGRVLNSSLLFHVCKYQTYRTLCWDDYNYYSKRNTFFLFIMVNCSHFSLSFVSGLFSLMKFFHFYTCVAGMVTTVLLHFLFSCYSNGSSRNQSIADVIRKMYGDKWLSSKNVEILDYRVRKNQLDIGYASRMKTWVFNDLL